MIEDGGRDKHEHDDDDEDGDGDDDDYVFICTHWPVAELAHARRFSIYA